MTEVEEVGSRMEAQLRLHAAEETGDLPLPALFDRASHLHALASSSSLDQVPFHPSSLPDRHPSIRAIPPDVLGFAWQEGIRRGVDLLRRCDDMVSNLGLFSSNETKDDVSTANLKYLLVWPLPISSPYRRI
jgi:hypothetical protein